MRSNKIPNSTIIYDFQDSRVLTSIRDITVIWRFQKVPRKNYRRDPSQFSTPLYSQLTLRIYAAASSPCVGNPWWATELDQRDLTCRSKRNVVNYHGILFSSQIHQTRSVVAQRPKQTKL